MRKYLFSGAVLGSLLAAVGLTRRSISGPRNLSLLLSWVSWLISLIVAILAVRDESAEVSEYYDLKDAKRGTGR